MIKMAELERIEASLSGIDCGSCGSPSCRALAEDIVRGNASIDDCIYHFRENMSSLIDTIQKLDDFIPNSLKNDKE